MHTDPLRLQQVISNLIGNAIKFTEEGKITFGYVLKNNRHIEFFVKDTGPGIPHNMLDLIFDRFGQVEQKTRGPNSGTGLGLSIAHEIIEAHGSAVHVESAPGEGATFGFELPIQG